MSTDSIEGQPNRHSDFDRVVNDRFPATAPHKESKEKKLFSAISKITKGTPKAGKNLLEEFSKKTQKSNIDIFANPKMHGIPSKSIKRNPALSEAKPSPIANALKMKKPLAIETGASTGATSVKNKSFRTEKLQHDYLKNNFFLKNNFLKNSTPKEGTRNATSKNARIAEEIMKHISRTQLNESDTAKRLLRKDEVVVTEEDAGKLKIEQMTFIEKKLHNIALTIGKDFEIYDQIKEYVDIVQEENYSEFFSVIRNIKIKLLVKNSMILERWALFFIFWFYFNHELAIEHQKLLKELVQLVHKNILIYLKMFTDWISKYPGLEVRAPDPADLQEPHELAAQAELGEPLHDRRQVGRPQEAQDAQHDGRLDIQEAVRCP